MKLILFSLLILLSGNTSANTLLDSGIECSSKSPQEHFVGKDRKKKRMNKKRKRKCQQFGRKVYAG